MSGPSLAETHAADAEAQARWAAVGASAFAGGHPTSRPAIFYTTFEDGSSAQITVTPDGSVTIEPGQQYDDEKAQSGELYGTSQAPS